jgi:O-antigen/teichoic acid export membrane protein
MALIQVYGTHLTATGHIQVFLRVSAFFALLNIGLNIFVIPAFGVRGAAWIAVATQSVFALAVTYLAVRKTGLRFAAADAALYLVLALVTVLVFKWLIL